MKTKSIKLMAFIKLNYIKKYHLFLVFLSASIILSILLYNILPSFSMRQCSRANRIPVNGGYKPAKGWEGRGCYCVDRKDRQTWKNGYSSTSYQCPRIPGSSGLDTDDDDTTDNSGIPYNKNCNYWKQQLQVNSCNGKKRYICSDDMTNTRNTISPLMRNLAEEAGWGSGKFCPTDEEANSCKSNLFFGFVFDNEWHCFDLINQCGGTEKLRWKRNWDGNPTSIFCEGDPQDKPNNDSSDKPNNNTSQECPKVKVIINSYPYKTGTVKLKCNSN